MLDILNYTIDKLPELLQNEKRWDSLIINRRKPHTYRIFTNFEILDYDGTLNTYRVCLHKFDPCNTEEAFAHPHPWPGAFCILKGKYKMNIGYSLNRYCKPENVAEFI